NPVAAANLERPAALQGSRLAGADLRLPRSAAGVAAVSNRLGSQARPGAHLARLRVAQRPGGPVEHLVAQDGDDERAAAAGSSVRRRRYSAYSVRKRGPPHAVLRGTDLRRRGGPRRILGLSANRGHARPARLRALLERKPPVRQRRRISLSRGAG